MMYLHRSYRTSILCGSLCVFLLLLAACGSTGSGNGTSNTPGSYDFSYSPHPATNINGTLVLGDWRTISSLNPFGGDNIGQELIPALFNGCVVQLPDLSLGDSGWKADQCTQVPSVANGGESADGLTTTLHLAPNALWSDGTPLTVDDFIFYEKLAADPNVGGDFVPFSLIQSVQKTDAQTLTIHWQHPYGAYLNALWPPLPVHAFNTGAFAGVYDANAETINDTLAQNLIGDPSFNTTFTVDNGAFTIHSFTNAMVVLTPNVHFHSNFFTKGGLKQIVFMKAGDKNTLIQMYMSGAVDHAEGLNQSDVGKFEHIPANAIVMSPANNFIHLDFNESPQAPNAGHNHGSSIFTDKLVRAAFSQVCERCLLLQTLLGLAGNAPFQPADLSGAFGKPFFLQGKESGFSCPSRPRLVPNERGASPNSSIVSVDPNAIITDVNSAPPGLDYTDQSFDYNNTDQNPPDFEPAHAAAKMDGEGYIIGTDGLRHFPDGTPLTVTLAANLTDPFRNQLAHALQQQWQQNLHIVVNVVQTTFAPTKFDVVLLGTLRTSDPGDLVDYFTSNGGGNYMDIHDATLDQMFAQEEQALDFTARQKAAQTIQEYIVRNTYDVPLYIQLDITLTSSKVGNYKQNPTFAGNEWNIEDWYSTQSS
jgi:ABC-type transport system substrate-binding protein